MEIKPGHFIPGFTEQLVGGAKGEKRTINVDFPQDFVAPEVSGKKGVYEVEILQIKEKILPEVIDDFAKQWGAENSEKLRAGIRKDLENELSTKTRRSIRAQLVDALTQKVQCELPDSLVQGETRNVIYDIVAENQQRGVTKEIIDEKKDEIFNFAARTAKDKLKTAFMLGRIAEKEQIKVTQQEVAQRVLYMAQEREIKPEKLVKELQKTNGFGQIHEQILMGKVIDFLEQHARILEASPEGTPAS